MITLSQEKLFMFASLFHKRKRIYTHYNDEKYKESPAEQDRIQINPNNLPTPGLWVPIFGLTDIIYKNKPVHVIPFWIKIPADCNSSQSVNKGITQWWRDWLKKEHMILIIYEVYKEIRQNLYKLLPTTI